MEEVPLEIRLIYKCSKNSVCTGKYHCGNHLDSLLRI